MANITLPENKKKEIIQSFIITTARYKFSVYEKRILSLIISSLQPQLEGKHLRGVIERDLFGDLRCEFPLKYICEDDKNYAPYIQAFDSLLGKKIRYQLDDDTLKMCTIIQDIEIKKRSGIVKFSLAKTIADLFLNFTKGYSKYVLDISLKLRSVASARMYELISNQSKPLTYNIDTLKQLFEVEKTYSRTSNFIQRVIEPARKELDEKGNWTFEYIPIKKGNKYTHITLIPKHLRHREPDEVQEQEKNWKLHPYLPTSIKQFLRHTCGFHDHRINQNEKKLVAFMHIHGNQTLSVLQEYWERCLYKNDAQTYLLGIIKNETKTTN